MRLKKNRLHNSKPMMHRSKGNMLIVALAFIFVLIVLSFAVLKLGQITLVSGRDLTAAEAASLAVAQDLSKIVVNDPHYGFVALTNYPPVYKSTIADDGEPVPVIGINDITGTARLETIIADQLDNSELRALAQDDAQAAKHAAKNLMDALGASIDPTSKYRARDLEGNVIKPYEHAKQLFQSNLTNTAGLGKATIENFQLSLGWLKDGAISCTRAPLPENMSAMPKSARLQGDYRAFVNIPACGESFYFAGLASQPSLVDASQFMKPDGKRICSVVRVDADVIFTRDNVHGLEKEQQSLHTTACAIPCAMPDSNTPGVLTITFPDGLVPGINSIDDIFRNRQFNGNKVEIVHASGGDFPIETQAKLIRRDRSESVRTIAQTFTQGFYDWLRTAHIRPRIDSVLDVVHIPFKSIVRNGSGSWQYPYLIYEFDTSGQIVTTNLKQTPFQEQTISENQNYACSLNAIHARGANWTMVFRDQVRRLGTLAGGKHAGQSLPGNPINWCELALFDAGIQQARAKGKGEALGFIVHGQQANGFGQGAIALEGAYFTSSSGTKLSNQPRKNYYSGGSCVYFELSSPLAEDRDIESTAIGE